MTAGFGECPKCGKMSLLVVEEKRDDRGSLIDVKVKCANCEFSKKLA